METEIILPLYKGKGAKANNKDNYRGITIFHTLCKVYETRRPIGHIAGRAIGQYRI